MSPSREGSLRRRRTITVGLLCTAWLLIWAPFASADGQDEALRAGDVAYPEDVSLPVRRAMDSMVREARREGYLLKVAIVRGPEDVPEQPSWVVDPQSYAEDIAAGLADHNNRVLVVSPVGLGGTNLGDVPARSVDAFNKPTLAETTPLVVTAMHAVAALTSRTQHPVALPLGLRATTRPDNQSDHTVVLSAVGSGVLLVGMLSLATVRRARRTHRR